MTKEKELEDFRHKEIITVALASLAEEMKSQRRRESLDRMRALMRKRSLAERNKGDNNGHD